MNKEKGIAIFTDGSCWTKDRIGGWGWIAIDIEDNTHEDRGYKFNTTINAMELTAPAMAMRKLYDRYGPCDLLIYSDSEYVVLGFNDPSRSRKANKKLWKLLDKNANLHHVVEFIHVRGHSDHKFNNIADKLAGEARKIGQDAYSNTQS